MKLSLAALQNFGEWARSGRPPRAVRAAGTRTKLPFAAFAVYRKRRGRTQLYATVGAYRDLSICSVGSEHHSCNRGLFLLRID